MLIQSQQKWIFHTIKIINDINNIVVYREPFHSEIHFEYVYYYFHSIHVTVIYCCHGNHICELPMTTVAMIVSSYAAKVRAHFRNMIIIKVCEYDVIYDMLFRY